MPKQTPLKDDWNPYDIFDDLEKARLEEVKKNARSRDKETRGSDEVSNVETSGGKVQTSGDSTESGTTGRPHDSGAGTQQEDGKLQKNVKEKKRGIKDLLSRRWKKTKEAMHGKEENSTTAGSDAQEGNAKDEEGKGV